MYWKLSELDDSLREKLAGFPWANGLGKSYFESQYRPSVAIRCLLAGLGMVSVCSTMAWAIARESQPPMVALLCGAGLIGLASFWTVMALVELIRGRASAIKPFLLVTPKVLLKTDFDYGSLEAYRLADATDFNSTDTYESRSQKYAGRQYTFQFPDGKMIFTVKSEDNIATLEEVLAHARQGVDGHADAGLSLIPSFPGVSAPQGFRAVTNPVGTFWVAVGAIFLMLILVGIVAAKIFGK